MDDRNLFATGVSLVIGGTILAATAAQNSTGWAWTAALFIGGGLYLVAASFAESVPWFGRAARRQRGLQKERAIGLLMRYHTSCYMCRDREMTEDQFQKWFQDLSRFVGDAWGSHQRSALSGGIWSGGNFYRMNEIETRLQRLIERVDDKEVSPELDLQKVPAPEWLIQETTAPQPD